jgi:carboxyl-terminal processing protease
LICVAGLGLAIVGTWTFGNHLRIVSALSESSEHDFSNLGWSEAFDEMNDLLEKDYAFGEWKAIDWESLHDQYGEEIIAAEKSNDETAYYLALRNYAHSLPDGHVYIDGNDFGLRDAAVGGGFGFAAIQTDDGKVIVHILEENSPATEAGMKWGAEIISWNNTPVQTAIDNVSLLWAATPPATNEGIKITKLCLLTRAPVGTSVSITFRNPDETEVRQVSLTAIDDNYSTFDKAYLMGDHTYEAYLKWEILPDGYGYIQIVGEMLYPPINPVGEVRKAVREFVAADVPGVIMDLRVNMGGYDEMAPLMMSFFATEPLFYEQIAMKDTQSGNFDITRELSLYPASPRYTGQVVMLVSNNTASTGEGFPLIMQSLDRGPVLGFYGTNASFGMAVGSVTMPGGYTVHYPNGASLDEDGNIQLDSDYTLNGGIQPDITVPIDMDNLKALYVDKRDVLMEEAIAAMER